WSSDVGASSLATALAHYLKEIGIPVLISDSSLNRLTRAKDLGINTHHGEILAEHAQFSLDLTPYETILSMSGDAAYNALVIQSYRSEEHTSELQSRFVLVFRLLF